MERKKKYTAPAVLEEFHLETEMRILYASRDVEDTDFEDVETMGQQVIEGDENLNFDHVWGE